MSTSRIPSNILGSGRTRNTGRFRVGGEWKLMSVIGDVDGVVVV